MKTEFSIRGSESRIEEVRKVKFWLEENSYGELNIMFKDSHSDYPNREWNYLRIEPDGSLHCYSGLLGTFLSRSSAQYVEENEDE